MTTATTSVYVVKPTGTTITGGAGTTITGGSGTTVTGGAGTTLTGGSTSFILDNLFVNNSLSLQGTVTGCGATPSASLKVGSTILPINSAPIYTPSGQGYSFSMSFDLSSSIPEGPQPVILSFYNSGSTCATSLQQTVTIDRTPPTVTLYSPGPAIIYSGQLSLVANVTDNQEKDRVEYLITPNDIYTPALDPSLLFKIGNSSNNFTAAIDTTQYPQCSSLGFTISATAYDKAGNFASTLPVTFNICN